MIRNLVALAAAAATTAALTACQSTAGGAASPPAPVDKLSPAANTAPSTTPSASPDPEAKLTGSCDYSLSDTMDGNDTFTAEIDVANTGNVSVKTKITVKWYQFGFAPIVEHRTVSVPWHQTVTVQFAQPVTTEQTLRLQSWQEHHDYNTPCTFTGDMVDLYGPTH